MINNLLNPLPIVPPAVRVYMISTAAVPYRPAAFTRFIQNDPRILGYWNYLPGTYFVRSGLDAKELTQAIDSAMTPFDYVVIEVNPLNANGKLPQTAWEWF